MRGRWHRARSLPIAGASSCLALVGVIAASAGIGYAPPIHPGEVALTLYPHATIALPSAIARDASGRIVAAGSFSGWVPYTTTPRGVAVVRFAASAAPDASFGAAGASTSAATRPLSGEEHVACRS